MYDLYHGAARSGLLLPWQAIAETNVYHITRLYLAGTLLYLGVDNALRYLIDTIVGEPELVSVAASGNDAKAENLLDSLLEGIRDCIDEVQEASAEAFSPVSKLFHRLEPDHVLPIVSRAYRRNYLCGGLIVVPTHADNPNMYRKSVSQGYAFRHVSVLFCMWIFNHWWVTVARGCPKPPLSIVLTLCNPERTLFSSAEKTPYLVYKLPRLYVCLAWRALVRSPDSKNTRGFPAPYSFKSLQRPYSYILDRVAGTGLPLDRRWWQEDFYAYIRPIHITGYTFWLARYSNLSGLSLLHPLSSKEFQFASSFDSVSLPNWQRLDKYYGKRLFQAAIEKLEIDPARLQQFQSALASDFDSYLLLHRLANA